MIKRGDIFWASLSESKGSVQKGNRPVLIIQNDVGNKHSATVIVACITSRIGKRAYPVNVSIPEKLLPKASDVRLNQILTVEKSQLGGRLGRLPRETMDKVDKAIRVSLGLPRLD
jgi:mRNA interferase MazF